MLLAGCGGPQSTLAPDGPAAQVAARLWWGMFVWFGLVLLLVASLWLVAWRRRPRRYDAEQARQVGLRWILAGGVLLPGLSILVLLAFGIPLGLRMLPLPLGGPPPLRIEVTGHQWWWEVRYPETGVVTANQLILPVGQPVDLELASADVIHAFWVPRLGGKLDMLPGRRLTMRLRADRAGPYRGQCAEFCGSQHAHMVLAVEALEMADFNAWQAARRVEPPVAREHAAAVRAFRPYCGECHRVAGISDGRRAPDLSDVGARPSLGAGTLAMEPGAMRLWLHEHQRLKPYNGMPRHDRLSEDTLDDIAAWLETLVP
ncbi:cytochrome c oxidase subunit II [Azorhizophilus paspali]|uniref:Cytochrome aa3 subunit 2 n=1 Tax=Azorhizophilus paspali TaxID=69963 RepID=A0ABV6SPG7_AZOPA